MPKVNPWNWIKESLRKGAFNPRSHNVANKQNKATKRGILARASALARKTIEKGKNASKNKALRRAVDDMLINPGALTALPGMGVASAVYTKVKAVRRAQSSGNATPCLKKWFTCLTEPFSPASTGACIPTGGNHPSMRNFGYLRFDAVIGTAGWGLVAISPSACNNNPVVFYSDATYSGIDLQLTVEISSGTVGLVPGVQTLSVFNNRFSFKDLTYDLANPLVTSRLVGGGVRVQYTGKSINLGGLIYVFTSPTHSCAVDNPDYTIASAASIGSYQECVIKPVTREPQEFVLAPLEERELAYSISNSLTQHSYPWSVGNIINGLVYTSPDGNPVGAPTTVIAFSGTPGETFHFEYGMHVESVGSLTEGQRMPAESDPTGVDNMMAAISNTVVEIASTKRDFAPTLRSSYAKIVAMSKHSASV